MSIENDVPDFSQFAIGTGGDSPSAPDFAQQAKPVSAAPKGPDTMPRTEVGAPSFELAWEKEERLSRPRAPEPTQQPSAKPARVTPPSGIDAMIAQAASAVGLDQHTLKTFAQIESGGRPDVVTGSYKGLFQLSDGEFRKYGGGDIFDPEANALAGARKLKAEADQFKGQFGRDPSGPELYMIHQQGWGGAQAHWANPTAPAWQSMASTAEGQQKGARWAKQAIWGNVPDDMKRRFGSVENITSADFTRMWSDKYSRIGARFGGPDLMDESGPSLLADIMAAAPEQRREILMREVERITGAKVYEARQPDQPKQAPLDFSSFAADVPKSPDSKASTADAASTPGGFSDPQQYLEVAKGVPGGAVKMLGIGAKGAARLDPVQAVATNAQRYVEDLRRVPTMTPEQLSEFRNRVAKEPGPLTRTSVQSAISDLLDGSDTMDGVLQRFAAPTPLAERGLYQIGNAIDDFAKSILPAKKGYEETIGRQLGEGVGSMVGGIPFALLGPAPAGMFFASAGMGEAADRAVEFDKAERKAGRKGLTQEQINAAALFGVAPGATDIIPMETLLGRLPIPVPPVLRKPLAQAIGRIGGQAFIEGLQEGGQAFLQNLIAREVYDPSQSLGEGLAGEAGLGAGVGGLVQTGKEIATGLIKSAAGRRAPHGPADPKGAAAEPTEEVAQRQIEGPKEQPASTPPAAPLPPSVPAGEQFVVPNGPTVPPPIPGEAPQAVVTPPPAPRARLPAITEADRQLLRQQGWSEADIDEMGDEEAADAAREARQQVASPLAPDRPSAEPIADLKAQAADLKDENTQRQAVWLPAASYEALQKNRKAAKEVLGAGVVLEDFDGQGGVLVAKDKATAATAVNERDDGVEMQEIIGRLTGAGRGKPADGTAVVQQVTPEGAVVRESLVRDGEVEQTVAEFSQGGKEVRVVAPDEALKRREEQVAADQQIIGTRAAPVDIATAEDVAAAGARVAEPTEKQAEAGNYAKGHIRFQGLDISLETPKGGTRRKVVNGKTEWEVPNMPASYGYIRGSTGADGEQIDVYIGDDVTSDRVYVIDQIDAESGDFDEHKVVLGARSEDEAGNLYSQSFSDGRGPDRVGGITEMSMDEFKAWARAGVQDAPVSSEIPAAGAGIPDFSAQAVAVEEGPAEDVWGQRFQKLMSGEYQKAVAGEDYSTQYDILSAKLNNSRRDPPEMRAAIASEIERLKGVLGPEWMAKYGTEAEPAPAETKARPAPAPQKPAAIEPPARYEGGPLSPEEIDAIVDSWRYVQEIGRRPRPKSLTAYIIERGGLIDGAREVRQIAGAAKERPGLVNQNGTTLDDAVLGAWEAGYFPEAAQRPSIAEFLDLLQDDLHTGTVVRSNDEALLEDIRIADEIAEEIANYGVNTNRFRSEASLREYFGQARPRAARETAGDEEAQTPAEDGARRAKADDGVTDVPFDVDESRVEKAGAEPARTMAGAKDESRAGEPSGVKPGEPEWDFIPHAGWRDHQIRARVYAAALRIPFKGLSAEQIAAAIDEKLAKQAGAPDGVTVRALDATLDEDEARIKGGQYKAVAQRVTPWNSVDGYGANPFEAVQAAVRKIGITAEKSGQTSLVAEATTKEKLAAEAKAKAKTGGNEPPESFEAALRDRLLGNGFKTIVEARQLAKAHGFEGTNKEVDEAVEVAVVAAAKELIAQRMANGAKPFEVYRALVGLYERQPNLAVRTSTSVANQAYSTPVPLAYLASRFAGVANAEVVYEPTAGNGALLIEVVAPGKVFANELDPKRAAALKAQGYRTTALDATEPGQPLAILETQDGADAIIMNPPFGAVRESGQSKVWKIGDYQTSTVDHAIALNALQAMTDDGRAVLILGGVNATDIEARREGYRAQAKRKFFARLYRDYNVTDHFTVSGDLYKKQGAGWPVDVVVIEGRGKSARKLPAAEPPTIFDSWDRLEGKLPNVNAPPDKAAARRPGAPNDRSPQGERASASGDAGGRAPAARGGPERLPAGTRDDASGVRGDGDRGKSSDVRSGADDARGVPAGPDRERGGVDKPAAPRREPVARKEPPKGSGQALYLPSSGAVSLESLVPSNMADATKSALKRVAAKHGDIDAFVANRLGYGLADLSTYFSAEQVDAVATAIDNIDEGAAFIIGDQCVAGETLILDPTTGAQVPIADLAAAGQPITVLSLTDDGFAPMPATAPFFKGVTDLYRVTLDDGSSIVVTRAHRFLTGSGWASLSSGVEVGTEIAASSPDARLQDRAGSNRLAGAREDGRRSTDGVQGSHPNCSRDLRPCGEPSPLEADSAQVGAPSQAGAHEHSRSWLHEGGPELSPGHSRQHRDSGHHAKNSSSPLESRDLSPTTSQAPASSEQQSEPKRQELAPSDRDSAPLHREDGAGAIGQHGATGRKLSSLPSGKYTPFKRVVAIQFDRRDAFYDMHVPGAFNYVANGLVNHNTGIGKGRVAAAMIRYALRKGWTPVFVTEKPDLYGDMFRDMGDIGLPKMLGREPAAFMTNTGESVPLDDEALAWKIEYDEAKAAGTELPKRRGRFLTAGGKTKQEAGMRSVLAGEGNYDVVFTTYDQMNTIKKQETDRRNFLRALAPKALLILDESHNAGGSADGMFEKKGTAPDRAKFVRILVASAAGVMYSSATFAKRPDVMDLYARTDMGKAVDDPKKLPALIARGGVPMQQIVATMLSDAGQYMRRERSFEGVEYAVETVPVDHETYRQFSDAIRSIFQFDLAIKETRAEFMKDILDEMGASQAKDSGVGEASANSIAFASIMHNIVNQMLLAIKADKVADRAIAAHKAGEKPVIAVANTMESFIGDYAEDLGIGIGKPIDITFADVLKRYLSRTLRITIKDADGNKSHKQIPVRSLPGFLQRMYADAEALIADGDFNQMPVSPIDWLRHRMTEAGMRVVEVTGRSSMMAYSTSGRPLYVARPKSEMGPSGKRSSIAAFNRGALDALILNRSGSTGVSMHASIKFKDQRRRRMIIAQAEGNIDTHLQMLGRVHRTGQVMPPAYSQVAAEIPAEARPTAVLMKKMASLNATTTGARGSAFMADAVDFMNEYGDRVIANIMWDEPEIAARLGSPLKENGDGIPTIEDAARRVTGRLVLLAPDEQTELLNRIQDEYKAEIARLDALGENALEAKTLDLQARLIESTSIKDKLGDGPFLDSAQVEKISVKAQGRAMAPSEVANAIADAIKVDVPQTNPHEALRSLEYRGREVMRAKAADIAERVREWIAAEVEAKSDEAKATTRKRLDETLAKWLALTNIVAPGARISMDLDTGQIAGIVLNVERTGKTKNLAALGSWTVTVAIPDSTRTVAFPMSKLFTAQFPKGSEESGAEIRPSTVPIAGIVSQLEDARREGRETRYVVTGNILAGYDQTNGRGRIVNFTMEDGTMRPGIFMARDFELNKFMDSRAVRLRSGAQVASFLDRSPRSEAQSSDKFVRLLRDYGDWVVETPAGRATGGRYYTDPGVMKALGYKQFQRSGGVMKARLTRSEFVAVVDAIRALGSLFEVTQDQELAQDILRKMPDSGEPTAAIGGGPVSFDAVEEAVFAGETVEMPAGLVFDQIDAIRPLLNLVPERTHVLVLERITPIEDGSIDPLEQKVLLTFKTPAGVKRTMNFKLSTLRGLRAFTMPASALGGRPGLFLLNIGGFERLGPAAAGEIWHEAVHILRREMILTGGRWDALLRHAKKLQVLDRNLRDVLRAVGDMGADEAPNLTVRQAYTRLYAGRDDKVEVMNQEAVAHMLELWHHGVISDDDMAPVRSIIENMRTGQVSGNRRSTEMDDLFAGLDAAISRPDADTDALGYYSGALRAAHNLRQERGTPEQMLAMLLKEGAKQAEIDATGLKQFIAGRRAVTRDEIVQFLEQKRVGLTEVVRSRGDDPVQREIDEIIDHDRIITNEDTHESGQYEYAGYLYETYDDAVDAATEMARAAARQGEVGDDTKWADYSLDSSNPTYRETVLHLPEAGKAELDRLMAERSKLAEQITPTNRVTPPGMAELSKRIEELQESMRATRFSSGHFSEPNIIGHMMTSMVEHDGQPVYLIDQIQSDWGQKLRDSGVSDEAKIAELKAAFEDTSAKFEEKAKAVPRNEVVQTSSDYVLGRRFIYPSQLRSEFADVSRLAAELATAQAATSGHPLVNTTDQWLNTTLRRAMRQAVEAGAEYIAVPTGDTVLSYNPGDAEGMWGFYGKLPNAHAAATVRSRIAEFEARGMDASEFKKPLHVAENGVMGIVPKNLRNILRRIDKDSPAPLKIDKVQTPNRGMAGRGFTLFRLTDRVKREVVADGQPLFAIGGGPSMSVKAPKARAELRDAVSEAVEIVQRIAGQVKVEFQSAIPASAIEPGAEGAAGGFYRPGSLSVEALVGLSLEAEGFDLRTAAGHEAWHHVERELATDPEKRLLAAPSEQARMRRMAAAELGREESDPTIGGMRPYEVSAYAFQRYRREREEGHEAKSPLHIGIRRFFDRVNRILRNVANAVRGLGYGSFEDIFERARTGEMAERAEADAMSNVAASIESVVSRAVNANEGPPSIVSRFLRLRTEYDEGGSTTLATAWNRYQEWAEGRSEERLSEDHFHRTMRAIGVQVARLAGKTRYIGIRFREPGQPDGTAGPRLIYEQDARDLAPDVAAGWGVREAVNRLIERLKSVIGRKPDMPRIARLDALRGVLANDNDVEAELHRNVTALADSAPEIFGSIFQRGTPTPAPLGTLARRVQRTLARVSAPLDQARVALQDKALPIRRLAVERVERETGAAVPVNLDTYVAEALYHGRAGERLTDLQERHVEPLLEHLRASGIDLAQLGDYLYARHAGERNAAILQIDPGNDAGSGMTDAEANAILARVRGSGQQAAMDQAAAMVDEILLDARRTLLRSGLIDRETYDAWSLQYANYVPLRGFDVGEDENPERARVGRGFDVRGRETMAALGRRSKADNPVIYAVMQAQQAVVRAEKNRVNKTLYRMIQANPNPAVWRLYRGEAKRRINPATGMVESYWVLPPFVRNDAVHGVKINGRQVWMELTHPALARAMRGVGADAQGTIVGRAMMKVTRAYASLLTSYNPEFLVSNYFRDVQTALMNATGLENKPDGMRRQIVADALSLKAVRGALQALRGNQTGEYGRWFEEYRLAGGKISFMEYNDVERIRRRMTASLTEGRTRRAIRSAAEYVEHMNTAVENGVRLSTYIAMRKAGVAQDTAAFTARELTVNFNRRGEWGPAINSMYLFFNASLQGITRIAQAATRSKAVRYGLAGIFASGLAIDLLNYLLAGDDDDGENRYDKVPLWVKERNLVLMNPLGSGDYLMVPMPYGYNTPFIAGQEASRMLRGVSTPLEGAARVAAATIEAFNPLGSAASFWQFVSPTMLDPGVQILENKNWFGGPIMPKKLDERKPESETYFASAPWWAVQMAKEMNSITGGNMARPGAIDISPEVLEHFAEFAGGGTAKFVMNTLNSGGRIVNGDEWLPEKMPFVRRIYGKSTGESRKREFYEAWDAIDAAHYEVTRLAKAGYQEGAASARSRFAAELEAYGTMKTTRKTLKALRDQRDRLSADETLSRDDRRARLDDIAAREKEILVRALATYRQAVKKQQH